MNVVRAPPRTFETRRVSPGYRRREIEGVQPSGIKDRGYREGLLMHAGTALIEDVGATACVV